MINHQQKYQRARHRSLILAAASLLAASLPAEATTVGSYSVPIVAGGQTINAPLHRVAAHFGRVQSISGNTITLTATIAGYPAGTLGPATIPPNNFLSFPQYVLMVTEDFNVTPGVQGDWFNITSNDGSKSVTVDTTGKTLTVEVGDVVEIRPRTALVDLFPDPTVLTADVDFSANTSDEDVLRTLSGLFLGSEIIYFDDGTPGAEGWLWDGEGPHDGTLMTLDPDQALVFQRLPASGTTASVVFGKEQPHALAHYIPEGGSVYGTGFNKSTPLMATDLPYQGMNEDQDLASDPTTEDVLRSLGGLSLSDEVIHFDGTGSPAELGWYVNGSFDPTYVLPASRGNVFQRLPGTSSLVWRQPKP